MKHGTRPTPPRILLVEDDPVSQAFLSATLEALPAKVDVAGSCAQALRIASASPPFALWLVDSNLPDGTGAALLASLRALPADPGLPPTIALAHTASSLRDELDALIQAGFAEVLVKPLASALLQSTVRRALGDTEVHPGADIPSVGKLPVWDDDAALRALNGQGDHVAGLRRLFLAELPGQRDAIAQALSADDAVRARDVLHRLRASCGFVGAARLGAAVEGLAMATRATSNAGVVESLQRFQEAVSDVLEASPKAS